MTDNTDKQRLDKWLWAARFYKTRSLASDAIDGGKVHVNGDRVKSSRTIQIGDRVAVRRNHILFDVLVCGLNLQRRPAAEAQRLYEETPASVLTRLEQLEQNKLLQCVQPRPAGRPSKKDRRQMEKFVSGNE